MAPAISEKAIQFIIEQEVSSQAVYELTESIPTWPGGQSGVTIGIGDDLGYMDPDEVRANYGSLNPNDLDRLCALCGLHGDPARVAVHSVRDIVIDWDTAMAAFRGIDIPHYTGVALRAFPGAETLSGDCLGALVSLVFNRGAGMDGDSRLEMREIRGAIEAGDYAEVPGYLRAMKRVWGYLDAQGDWKPRDPDMKGLLARRDAEAAMFEAGLNQEVAPDAGLA